MIRRLFAMVLALSLVAVFGVAGADLLEDVQARGNLW